MTRYAVAWVIGGKPHPGDGDAYVVCWPPVWTDGRERIVTLLAGPYDTEAEAAAAFLTHPSHRHTRKESA